jgi:hypothetical protein
MLQISTGKFYASTNPDAVYETLHRGVLYTNYKFMVLDRIETGVGVLLPAKSAGGVTGVVCEIPERLPKPSGPPQSGQIISVGSDFLIRDFAAIVSFAMNITCDPDRDLVQRLTNATAPALGLFGLANQYVPRMFDAELSFQMNEVSALQPFFKDLMGLERKAYLSVNRSIRRYVMAMHRLSDDLDLAYALLVASIEALAQEFDGTIPVWEYYDERKRIRIDEALMGATEPVRQSVRDAILDIEHVALKRKFSSFTNHYLSPSFFRSGTDGHLYPAGRSELTVAIKKAYDLRSTYIHTLKPLPKNLVSPHIQSDVFSDNGRLLLSFRGLARVARHVILEFISQSQKIDKEEYDYTADYPNLMVMQLDSHYWLHRPECYTPDNARNILSCFIKQHAARMADTTQRVSDMRAVLQKIQEIVPSLASAEQKIPMLALYSIFSQHLPEDELQAAKAFFEPHAHLFDQPLVESLVVYFLAGEQVPNWSTDESDRLLAVYAGQRFHKNGLDVGPLVGALLVLWIAEQQRKNGNQGRARELITYVVEEYPMLKTLQVFEQGLPAVGDLPEILAMDILLPDRKTSPAPPPSSPPEPTLPSAPSGPETQTMPADASTSSRWMRWQQPIRAVFRRIFSVK